MGANSDFPIQMLRVKCTNAQTDMNEIFTLEKAYILLKFESEL